MYLRHQAYPTNMLFVILAIAQCIVQQIGATVYQEYLKPPIFRDLFNTAHPTPRLSKLHHIHYFLFGQQLLDNPFHQRSASPVVDSRDEVVSQSSPVFFDLNEPADITQSAHKAMTSSSRRDFRNGVPFSKTSKDFLINTFTHGLFHQFPVGIRQSADNVMSRISSGGESKNGHGSDPGITNGAQTETFSGTNVFSRPSDPSFDQLSEEDRRKRNTPVTVCKPRRLSLEWLIIVLRRGKACIKRANILRWGAGGR